MPLLGSRGIGALSLGRTPKNPKLTFKSFPSLVSVPGGGHVYRCMNYDPGNGYFFCTINGDQGNPCSVRYYSIANGGASLTSYIGSSSTTPHNGLAGTRQLTLNDSLTYAYSQNWSDGPIYRWNYSSSARTFTSPVALANNSNKEMWGSCLGHDGRIYVGGIDPLTASSVSAYVYNISTNSWSSMNFYKNSANSSLMSVTAIAYDRETKTYITGAYTAYNGFVYIHKEDGTFVDSININAQGTVSQVDSICIIADYLYVGVNGNSQNQNIRAYRRG